MSVGFFFSSFQLAQSTNESSKIKTKSKILYSKLISSYENCRARSPAALSNSITCMYLPLLFFFFSVVLEVHLRGLHSLMQSQQTPRGPAKHAGELNPSYNLFFFFIFSPSPTVNQRGASACDVLTIELSCNATTALS